MWCSSLFLVPLILFHHQMDVAALLLTRLSSGLEPSCCLMKLGSKQPNSFDFLKKDFFMDSSPARYIRT